MQAPHSPLLSHASPPPPMPPLAAILLLLLLLLLSLFLVPSISAHNITLILAKHPEFSTFNHYLTLTHLAAEINRRETITVLALDNAAMSDLLGKQLSVYTLKNVLSMHVLVDYFGEKKLQKVSDGSTVAATMFQATGSAPGTSGYVNITDLKGGKVAFGSEDNDGKLNSVYVKSIKEIPYKISVLQISQVIKSVEAEAPTPEPSQLNLTDILYQGCKTFSNMLKSTGAGATFNQTMDTGLTVFCPSDSAITSFMPKYKLLTATQKSALLLYHGIPVYQSMQTLKSSNGITDTLATDGANRFEFTVQNDGDQVALKTSIVTAKVTGTLKDEEPLVVYKVDKVLQPIELFRSAKGADGPSEADAPSGTESSVDQKNDGGGGLSGRRFVLVPLYMWIVALVI